MLLALACFIVMLSSLVQTAIGFGMGLIAVPFLILIDPEMVPAPIIMIAFVQLAISAWVHRSDIEWNPLLLATIARIPGTALAVWLMSVTGTDGIKIFIACAVFAAVAISLFKINAEPNTPNHLIAGFFSGLSGTATGIGGPPMALLYQYQPADFVRANLSAFFAIGSLVSLAGMAMGGLLTLQSWVYFVYFLPATLAGVWLGMRSRHLLRPTFMRPAILILCSASAAALLIQTLLG
ncbi:MAG: sulfite exporter TauE/SafE family protein [Halopseudomonas sp.]